MPQPPLFILAGPTGVGKTDVAVTVARQLNAEIVSCDAMQIYRETRILSAKPSSSVLAEIPHHLIDVVSIEEEFDVHRFRHAATAAINDITARGKNPLLVGGSGLYISILLDGIFETEEDTSTVRAELKEKNQEELFSILREVDPEVAGRIHANDNRRTIRALEVYYATGKPMSFWHSQRSGLADQYDVRAIVLNRDRDDLYGRIEARVDAMFDEGVLEEIASVRDKAWSKTASRMIGVPQILDLLDGRSSLEETKSLIKQNTRRYAKRQLTWFRKDARLRWLDNGTRTQQEAAEYISQVLRG